MKYLLSLLVILALVFIMCKFSWVMIFMAVVCVLLLASFLFGCAMREMSQSFKNMNHIFEDEDFE